MYANLQSHALDIFGQASNPGSARWLLAPNIWSRVTRKCYVFSHTNLMLGTLDFTGSLHLAPFNFP